MKLRAVLAAAWLAACAPADSPPDGNPAAERATGSGEACATIVSTNDTHGRLLPETYGWSDGREVGGSAAVAAHFDRVREEDAGCPVFVFSAGDLMQGTLISNLSEGEAAIAAMNAMGYDAAAIGNHEFDWGVPVLEERIDQASFAMLGANIFEKGTDRHPGWATPYAIVEREGVRIGVVGATSTSTPTSTKPANVTELEFRSIAEALDRYIPEVRAEGVDFVVAVMHEGGFCRADEGCAGEALAELAATRERFDYAVTGHTHSLLEIDVGGVPVVQSYSSGMAFGVGRLMRSRDGAVTAELLGVRRPFVDEVTPNPEVAALVAEYRARVSGAVDRVVARLGERLGRDRRTGDYALGRLIADAQRATTGTQVAIMNNGGIRRNLPAGPVTYGTLFELQPFQNTLVRLKLQGRYLLAALEHAIDERGVPDANLSGLTASFDPSAPSGSRVIGAILADGRPIRPDGSYSVTVNDFMAGGGSGYFMFTRALTSEFTGVVDLDALVDYLAAFDGVFLGPSERRWIVERR